MHLGSFAVAPQKGMPAQFEEFFCNEHGLRRRGGGFAFTGICLDLSERRAVDGRIVLICRPAAEWVPLVSAVDVVSLILGGSRQGRDAVRMRSPAGARRRSVRQTLLRPFAFRMVSVYHMLTRANSENECRTSCMALNQVGGVRFRMESWEHCVWCVHVIGCIETGGWCV